MKLAFLNVAAIVLAAGESTRFHKGKPASFQKVLLEISGKPMIDYTIDILKKLELGQIVIVIGHYGEDVKKHLGPNFTYAIQTKRLGTGNAAKCGLKKIRANQDTILVINGDDSFKYRPKTLAAVLKRHQNSEATLTFVTLEKENPKGLGRVVRNSEGEVTEIVEEKDATSKQRRIKEVNDGVYVFNKRWLVENISKIRKSPQTGELYLVDLIRIGVNYGAKVKTYKLNNPAEWFGVNTPEELILANQ